MNTNIIVNSTSVYEFSSGVFKATIDTNIGIFSYWMAIDKWKFLLESNDKTTKRRFNICISKFILDKLLIKYNDIFYE